MIAEEVVKRLPVVMKDAAIARPLAAATRGGEGCVEAIRDNQSVELRAPGL